SGEGDETAAAVLTELDAVGNATTAITKGIAIATAVLAATALFGSYVTEIVKAVEEAAAGGELPDSFGFEVVNPNVLVGVIVGASVVFLVSGLVIHAVCREAVASGVEGGSAF